MIADGYFGHAYGLSGFGWLTGCRRCTVILSHAVRTRIARKGRCNIEKENRS